MDNKNVLLFCSGINEILGDTNKVGGIQVQMLFWGKVFAAHGWFVYSLSEEIPKTNSQTINFIKVSSYKFLSRLHLEIIQDFMWAWRSINISNPSMVLVRGASRGLYFLNMLCKLKGIKLVYFGASDSDFIPEKEIVGGSSFNRKMYQTALKSIDYIVTQNEAQRDALRSNYGKESLTLANIWIPSVNSPFFVKKYDVIWVAYLRPLKRVEWFLELARQLPQFRFAIAGGVSTDQNYFNKIEKEAKDVQNLSFLGALSFNEINNLLAQSKLLACTSEFEGFPNTFLQAWAQSVPVVSTVNPSSVVSEHQLGVVVSNFKELLEQTLKLLKDDSLYTQYQTSIKTYFLKSHDADKAFDKLIEFLHV